MTTSEKNIKNIAIVVGIIFVIVIVSLIILGVSLFINFTSKSNKNDVLNGNVDVYEIDELHIELESTNIEIIRSDEFKIEKFDVKDSVQFETIENSLRIVERSKYFWNSSLGGTIVIYLPADLTLKDVFIDMGAGKIKLESVDMLELEIEQGAGNIYMDECTAEEIKIDGGAGKIDIKNSSLENLELNSGVGSVNYSGELLGKSEINGGVGSINMTLDGNEDFYKIDIDKGIGAIMVDGNKATGTIGNGPNIIDISGGVGNINIKFR